LLLLLTQLDAHVLTIMITLEPVLHTHILSTLRTAKLVRRREDLSTLRGRAPRFLLLLRRSGRIRTTESLVTAASAAVTAAHVVLPHDVDVLLERPVQ
jgi:hypothetical protein